MKTKRKRSQIHHNKMNERRKRILSSVINFLPVGLGNTLDLILLLDGVRVGATLSGVDDLISEALGEGLEVAEGSLAGTLAHHVDGLVHAAHGRHIDGLATDETAGTDTGRVLTGGTVGDSIDDHLDGVAVRQEVHDLEGVAHHAGSLQLATVTATLEHEAVRQALHDRDASLEEASLLPATSGVGHVRGGHGDVLGESGIRAGDTGEGPLVEQLGSFDRHGQIRLYRENRERGKDELSLFTNQQSQERRKCTMHQPQKKKRNRATKDITCRSHRRPHHRWRGHYHNHHHHLAS
ncbi:hypothetical protein AGDE_00919 [Angomonas deanei]|nr:hypothetical protein AGDE_00919 [Angomonas deanei]|eukprot:EPY43004.1 hypothetical protein AGDE_00919 [Angomonas deanei]